MLDILQRKVQTSFHRGHFNGTFPTMVELKSLRYICLFVYLLFSAECALHKPCMYLTSDLFSHILFYFKGRPTTQMELAVCSTRPPLHTSNKGSLAKSLKQ